MKWARRLPAAVVFLILGYAVNAWGVQRLADWHVRHQLESDNLWVFYGFDRAHPFVRDAYPWDELDRGDVASVTWRGLYYEQADARDENRRLYTAVYMELGLPFRCVRIKWNEDCPPNLLYINLMRSQLWDVGVPAPKAIAGPVFAGKRTMSPWIWWGALLNSVTYALPIAGAWYLTKAGVLASVRAARREKGLCPRCSYDVRGLDQCPECGESLAERRSLRGRGGGTAQ